MTYANKKQSKLHVLTRNYQFELVLDSLTKTRGNIFKTAKELGVSRNTVYKILATDTLADV